MSVFKTTFSRALRVAVTTNCDIPSPNVIVSGISSSVGSDRLIDNTVDFITLNVKEGDIVYDTDNYEGATVIEVENANTLRLNADIFTSEGNYAVYQASSQTGLGNQGCYLYIGSSEGATSIQVVTIGGDLVTFSSLIQGTVLPVQVIALLSATGVDKIVALW